MRTFIFLPLFMFLALPAHAGKRVTVKQLDKAILENKDRPDEQFSKWLYGMELSERVDAGSFERWKSEMPGRKSIAAITAVTDLSAFLNQPPEAISKTPTLDSSAQSAVLDLADRYIENALSKLPNFFATQAITTYEDTPAAQQGMNYYAYEPLHFDSSKGATVYYRNGKEVMETRKGEEIVEDGQTVSLSSGLLSSGEFGPVLRTVLSDARTGKLNWSHWETGVTSKVAIFSYTVPRGRSHYKVKLEMPGHSKPFEVRPGYHGEIGIDPVNGTILRLTLKAVLTDEDPITQADLMVEYGSVEIGAKSYICPVKSIALVQVVNRMSMVGRSDDYERNQSRSIERVMQTILNDVSFVQYQVLRTEAKILSGADTQDDGAPH